MSRTEFLVQFLVIRLDPSLLENPNADLRYHLPCRIAEYSRGRVREDCFDYGPQSNHMFLFLSCDSPEQSLSDVIHVLEKERILGNRLSPAAVVAIQRHLDEERYVVVYPQDRSGESIEVV